MEWGDEWGQLWGGAIADIDNHAEVARSRVIGRFREKPNFTALLNIMSERWQRIENMLADILTVHSIDGAFGAIQDDLGEVLRYSRKGFGDDFYRVLLRTMASVIIPRRRTVEGLLTALRSILNDNTRTITYVETPPKAYRVTLSDLTAAEISILPFFIGVTRPITYNGSTIISTSGGFQFGDTTGALTPTGGGYADDSGAVPGGGEFAYLI